MYVRLSRAEGKFTNRRLKWNWRQNALCEYNIIVFLFFCSVCIIFCVYRVFLAYIIRKTYYIRKRVRVSPVRTGTRGLDDVDWKRKEETFLCFQIGMSRLRILELSNDRVAARYPWFPCDIIRATDHIPSCETQHARAKALGLSSSRLLLFQFFFIYISSLFFLCLSLSHFFYKFSCSLLI